MTNNVHLSRIFVENTDKIKGLTAKRAIVNNTLCFTLTIVFKAEVFNLSFSLMITIVCEISSSHGGEYEVQNCLLGCTAV
jgi:hypothetical protein